MFKEVVALEKELMNVLELAFKYASNKQYAKLKICMEAMLELEQEHKEITKANFIKQENIERLLADLEKLEKEYNENPHKDK